MNVTSAQYDVFLSYNWRDQEPVEAVANALRERGLNVFLDRWYLVPGKPWPQALEEVLQNCRSVAVFLSANGMGPWQQREQYLALERQTKDSTLTVIPVLLPGSDPALGFIGLNTWVDLRKGINDPGALEVLVGAVGGQALGPAVRERAQAMLANMCPYRGLQAFREEDAPFFFGRDAYVSQLAQKVSTQSFIAVVGASGSGKSSVVRAGLVPTLRRNGGGTVWEVVTLVPADRPLHALAAALAPLLEPEMTEIDRLAEIGKMAGHFDKGSVALRDVVERVLKKQPGTDRLLLVVDQWEELYTLSRDEQYVRKFIDDLLEATAAVPVSVVLTVRGDFFGRVLSYRALEDRLRDGIVTLGPMNRDELRQVVTKPAEKTGLAFQSGLSNRLLDDVGEEPGNLPLLEFVLTSLWDHRHRGELSHEAYDAIGGMQGAIAARADETYKQLGEVQQAAVRRIFLQLVRPGAGSEDTRRRAALTEVGEEAQATLGELAKQRLLVTGRDDSTGEETVEVAHEALIKHWSRLREWLDEDRDFLTWRERLQGGLGEWQRTKHDAGTLLRGAPLAEAERWYGQRRQDFGPEERSFIAASIRSRNRKRGFIRIGATFVVITALAAAIWQYIEAERLRAAQRPIIPEMVEVSPERFMMGAADNDRQAPSNERPAHEVVIKKPFKIGKYEVTFAEYDKFTLATDRRPPSDQGWGAERRPTINVSWEDAQAYVKWLSEQTGKRYRLPTEAEWEYAARSGGRDEVWSGTSDEKQLATYAVFRANRTEPVGSRKPNRLGLYDMSGNVWEWVEDCWHDNYSGAPADGRAWKEENGGQCGQRVIRGGSWFNKPVDLRSSARRWNYAGFRNNLVGFRLAQDLS